jgi:prolyl oligopeptidase
VEGFDPDRDAYGWRRSVRFEAGNLPLGGIYAPVTVAVPKVTEGAGVTLPAVARTEVIQDVRFGTTLVDPYRWMEDSDGDEFRAWLESQAAYAEETLSALPRREALLARIIELSGAAATRTSFKLAGERVFCLRQDEVASAPVLAVRDLPDGVERVLMDPNTIVGEAKSSIDWYVPSPRGRYVAVGTSRGGSERSVLHVVDAADGTLLGERISRVHHPFVSWAGDEQTFTYHRYRDVPASTPPGRRREDSGAYLHRLGDDPERDQLLLARDLNSCVPMGRRDRPFVVFSPPGTWMLAIISHGPLTDTITEKLSECTIYFAPTSGTVDPSSCPWTRIAGVEDGVEAFAADGDSVYLVSRRDAPRHRVLAIELVDADLARASVVVPEGERVIQAVDVVGDRLIVRELAGVVGRMRETTRMGGELREIPLPFHGTIEEWAVHPERSELLLRLASWTDAPRLYRYDPDTGAVEDTGWLPRSHVNFSEVEAREVQVPARDGTLIPLSIIHRRGLALDGENPTLLTAYGSSGLSLLPEFQPEMLAWYERGGVYAVAHVRGGGEHGHAWHEAGRGLNKEATITDFIDCAEYLVAQGYTRPARLAGSGGSAGGVPTGGALVRRPDLWAAMVMHVPVTNATRIEFSENGPINVAEFGSVTTEDGLRGLLLIDSYLRVRDGVEYPAVLLTAGLNDQRVAVWQPAKMTARLQAATTSDRPVLLRVERHGGHGPGTTRSQQARLLADEFAFLLDQFDREPPRP